MAAKLRGLWQAWKRIGQLIGDFIGRLALTVFYFTIFLPFGLGTRLFGDPLKLRSGPAAGWEERRTRDLEIEQARRMS